MALNRICMMGNVVDEPTLKYTGNGQAVCSFSIAVDRDHALNGERITDYMDVVMWGELAEFAGKTLHKSKSVVVEGAMHSRKWRDKYDQSRVSWELRADNFYFADRQGGGKC